MKKTIEDIFKPTPKLFEATSKLTEHPVLKESRLKKASLETLSGVLLINDQLEGERVHINLDLLKTLIDLYIKEGDRADTEHERAEGISKVFTTNVEREIRAIKKYHDTSVPRQEKRMRNAIKEMGWPNIKMNSFEIFWEYINLIGLSFSCSFYPKDRIPNVDAKLRAVQILKEKYEFNSNDSCIQMLYNERTRLREAMQEPNAYEGVLPGKS